MTLCCVMSLSCVTTNRRLMAIRPSSSRAFIFSEILYRLWIEYSSHSTHARIRAHVHTRKHTHARTPRRLFPPLIPRRLLYFSNQPTNMFYMIINHSSLFVRLTATNFQISFCGQQNAKTLNRHQYNTAAILYHGILLVNRKWMTHWVTYEPMTQTFRALDNKRMFASTFWRFPILLAHQLLLV